MATDGRNTGDVLNVPRIDPRGNWVCDLSDGRRIVIGRARPPGLPVLTELQAGAALLAGLLAAPAQQALSPTLGTIFDELRAARATPGDARAWRTVHGRRWWDQARARLRPWDARRMLEFEPGQHHMSALALEVRTALRAEVGGKRAHDVLTVLWQALRWAVDGGWLQRLPRRPSALGPGESLRTDHRAEWWVEADMRALRAALYRDLDNPRYRVLRDDLPGAALRAGCASVAEFIAKRRLFVSFSYYTGMRRADLESLDNLAVSTLTGQYSRRGQKTGVAPKKFPMPAQLADDVDELLRLLGRPFRSGEKILAGRWPTVTAVWRAAAQAAKLPLRPAPTPMVFRRSCAREYALRGWERGHTADILGHVDTKMVTDVYEDPAIPQSRGAGVPWDAPIGPREAGKTAVILDFSTHRPISS